MIQSVQAVNDHEVLITLRFPFVPFLSHLAHTATSIVSQRAVTELGEDRHSLAPIGTGAYRVVSVTTGDRIELTRWDRFWGTPARIRDLTWRSIVDGATRLLELETGGIDIMLGLQTMPHDIPRVAAHPDLRVLRQMSLSTNYIGFNCSVPPLNDVRVRQAIYHALDLDAINRAVNPGVGATGRGPINSMVWASAAERLPRYDFNQARSRQLLAEAGFPNGFSTRIYVNEGNLVRADTAEIMQNMLAQVGINAEVRIIEWGAYLDMTARAEHTIFILGWVSVTGDPDYGLHPLFHTENFGAAGNRTFYSNPELDRLLDAGRMETNPARREQIYFDAQRIVHRDVPWIFWHTGENVHATRADVRGFQTHPADYIKPWEIYFE
jgi:peptide/nickel transport system substrate-binding protein